jgi:hypothetical protein
MGTQLHPSLRLSFVGLFTLSCAAPTTDETANEEGTSGDGDGDGDGDPDQLPPCEQGSPGSSLPGPPTLVSAAIVGDRLVQLSFTEPIATVDDLDPSAFRLSIAHYDDYYAETTYLDPLFWICGHTDGCFGDYVEVVELGCVADDPNAMLLRVDILRDDIFCPLFDYQAMYGYVSHLLPHFDAMIALVADLDGEALASISAEWVTNSELVAGEMGSFPNYPSLVPIPCP